MPDFDTSLIDELDPLAADFHPGRADLLIAFGGLARRIGIPMFEFNRITSHLEHWNKIYLRDQHALWYHAGLRGLGNNIDEITAGLRYYRHHPATRRVVTIGNSGGGYAALLFGSLLGADEVHAFSPKTSLHPLRRLLSGEDRHLRHNFLRLFLRGQRKYLDLLPVLARTEARTIYHIYYSENHPVDRQQALYLSTLPNVCLHPYPYNDHSLIKRLKTSGELRKILDEVFRPVSN